MYLPRLFLIFNFFVYQRNIQRTTTQAIKIMISMYAEPAASTESDRDIEHHYIHIHIYTHTNTSTQKYNHLLLLLL